MPALTVSKATRYRSPLHTDKIERDIGDKTVSPVCRLLHGVVTAGVNSAPGAHPVSNPKL